MDTYKAYEAITPIITVIINIATIPTNITMKNHHHPFNKLHKQMSNIQQIHPYMVSFIIIISQFFFERGSRACQVARASRVSS